MFERVEEMAFKNKRKLALPDEILLSIESLPDI